MDAGIGMRIHLIIKRKRLTQEAFSKSIHTSRPTVGKWLSGTIAPSYEFLSNIMTTYPDLNGHWLLTGVGEMFIKKVEIPSANESQAGYGNGSMGDLIKAKDAAIKDKDEEIKFLRKLVSDKHGI